MKNYYSVLGISPNASPEDIKAAYKKMAFQYHPDRCHEPGAEAKMREINEAYEALTSPRKQPRVVNPYDSVWQRVNIEDIFNNFNFHFSNQQQQRVANSQLNISFAGNITDSDILEIERMLMARGCKVTGHAVTRQC